MRMASYEERNALKPIMHEHDNLKGTRGGDQDRIPRTLSSNTIVIVSGLAAKLEPLKTIKRLTLSPTMKRTSSSSEQSDTYQRRRPLFIIEFL